MQPLNTYRFYELGAKLHGLFSASPQTRIADMFAPLTEAQALLDSFIKGDFFALEESKTDATRLLNKIGALFNRYYIDPATKQLKAPGGEDRVDPHEMSLVNSLVEKFEHALAAELNRTPTYLAGKLGIYATHELAENAQNVFSPRLRKVIPTPALDEFKHAGRALAFGLGTAGAMHMLRAVELMLRVYYESFAGAPGNKADRNAGAYLKKLTTMSEDESKAVRPDRRVIQMLSQIKEHYRNPLIAPETAMSADEANQLFGLTGAIISLMAEQIESRRRSEGKLGKGSALTAEDDDGEDDGYDYPVSQAG